MPIQKLHTFLTRPNKGQIEAQEINGAEVPPGTKVFGLLTDLYNNAEIDCKVAISFNPADDGGQENNCRSLLLEYAASPSVETGLQLALRLSAMTTRRSGLGLFFLALGTEGTRTRMVLARFAANSGILADETNDALQVEFIERVFLRSIHSFKAVMYQDELSPQAFWTGKAVDHQINNGETEVSKYWIADFLDSDFRTTAATGTRILAVAMKDAVRKTSVLAIKKEITAAAALGTGLDGQAFTANQFLERFGLSDEAKTAISNEMRFPHLANNQFQFSHAEFSRQLSYKTVELDSGALMTALTSDFDEVFVQSATPDGAATVFSATGNIRSEKLEKSVR